MKKVLRFGRKARTLASTTNPKKDAPQPSSNFTTTSTLESGARLWAANLVHWVQLFYPSGLSYFLVISYKIGLL